MISGKHAFRVSLAEIGQRLCPISNKSPTDTRKAKDLLSISKVFVKIDDYRPISSNVSRVLNRSFALSNPDNSLGVFEDQTIENKKMRELAICGLSRAKCNLVRADVHREPSAALGLGQNAQCPRSLDVKIAE